MTYEALKKENEELKNVISEFCFHTLCSQCPFKDDSFFCKLSKLFTNEED